MIEVLNKNLISIFFMISKFDLAYIGVHGAFEVNYVRMHNLEHTVDLQLHNRSLITYECTGNFYFYLFIFSSTETTVKS